MNRLPAYRMLLVTALFGFVLATNCYTVLVAPGSYHNVTVPKRYVPAEEEYITEEGDTLVYQPEEEYAGGSYDVYHHYYSGYWDPFWDPYWGFHFGIGYYPYRWGRFSPYFSAWYYDPWFYNPWYYDSWGMYYTRAYYQGVYAGGYYPYYGGYAYTSPYKKRDFSKRGEVTRSGLAIAGGLNGRTVRSTSASDPNVTALGKPAAGSRSVTRNGTITTRTTNNNTPSTRTVTRATTTTSRRNATTVIPRKSVVKTVPPSRKTTKRIVIRRSGSRVSSSKPTIRQSRQVITRRPTIRRGTTAPRRITPSVRSSRPSSVRSRPSQARPTGKSGAPRTVRRKSGN